MECDQVEDEEHYMEVCSVYMRWVTSIPMVATTCLIWQVRELLSAHEFPGDDVPVVRGEDTY